MRISSAIVLVGLVGLGCSGCASESATSSTEVPPATAATATPDSAVDSFATDPVTASVATDVSERSASFDVNDKLVRTLNLGRTLERARDGSEVGPTLDSNDLVDIAATGFTAVRLPIDFDAWAELDEPYLIDPALFELVDEVLTAAESNGLAVVIDMHAYEAINEDPDAHTARLLAMWKQIATRYRGQPADTVVYEVLNEPNSNLTSAVWNRIMADAVAVIRTTDQDRSIVVGPTNWSDSAGLEDFELPNDDNLIVTFHYYDPFEFTHQGTHWIDGTEQYVGTQWNAQGGGASIAADLAAVADWAAEHAVPVFLGEFGSYFDAGYDDRVEWTRWVRESAESEGFSWGYWDWAGAGFGLQDDANGAWDDGLLEALMS
jgi:endoglucanase